MVLFYQFLFILHWARWFKEFWCFVAYGFFADGESEISIEIVMHFSIWSSLPSFLTCNIDRDSGMMNNMLPPSEYISVINIPI